MESYSVTCHPTASGENLAFTPSRTCSDQPTSTINNGVDDTAYYPASAQSWTRTTVAEGHKIFGVKASVPETSRQVVKRHFYLHHLHTAPQLVMIPSEFLGDFSHHKTRVCWLSCSVVCVILCLSNFVQLRLVTDGQTDGQRDGSKYRAYG